MRKAFIVAVMMTLVLLCASALEGTVTWTWYENDPRVEYYRYQVDGQDDDKWTVVDKYVSEVSVVLDVSVLHTLYLQQSYDGILWSASASTDSEIFEEQAAEEEVPAEEPWEPEPQPAEEIPAEPEPVEEAPAEPAEPVAVYVPVNAIDFGAGYMNHIPDSSGPKALGIFASYSRPVITKGVFNFGVKVNLGLYTSKNLIFDTANTTLFPYAGVLAQVSFRVASSDIYAALGPEFGARLITDPSYTFGLDAELGVRYHRWEKIAIGFAVADHYYLYPRPERANRMEFKAFLGVTF